MLICCIVIDAFIVLFITAFEHCLFNKIVSRTRSFASKVIGFVSAAKVKHIFYQSSLQYLHANI